MPEQNDTERLLKYIASDRKDVFLAHVRDLVTNDECYGIDGSSLGFMEDYENFAALVKRKADVYQMRFDITAKMRRAPDRVDTPFTVYDIGCSHALQHVVFGPEVDYVGVDVFNPKPPVFFRDRCRYVQGRFTDVVESLNIDRDAAFGIANMSLLYGSSEDEIALFKRTFKRLVLL